MYDFPIASIIELLLIACAVGMLMRAIKQPYTIGLVLVGLVVAITKLTPKISLTHDVAFYLILPPILFQGGMHLNLEYLKKDWKPITLLAIPGVIFCTFIVGYSLSYFWHIPLDQALLFGSLIAATDPVSVLANLKKVRAPERLRTLLEAESLFNDGTGVVLFIVILNIVQNKEVLNLPQALLQFLLVTVGGALVGALCAWIIYKLIKLIDDPFLEIALTVVLAFGSTLIAENLHCSGIIAVVVAGLVMGKGRSSCLSPKAHEVVSTFWETVDFILNSLIFLLIGIQLQVIGTQDMLNFKEPILIGVLVVLVSRALIVYPGMFLFNQASKDPIPSNWSHLLFWGGLRGTIPNYPSPATA